MTSYLDLQSITKLYKTFPLLRCTNFSWRSRDYFAWLAVEHFTISQMLISFFSLHFLYVRLVQKGIVLMNVMVCRVHQNLLVEWTVIMRHLAIYWDILHRSNANPFLTEQHFRIIHNRIIQFMLNEHVLRMYLIYVTLESKEGKRY